MTQDPNHDVVRPFARTRAKTSAAGPQDVASSTDGVDDQIDSEIDSEIDSWVEAAARGDLEAFENLYRHHVGRVHALCLRMCGDPQEAEELTQDAFVRAWEKLDSFRGASAFSSWLHRLTVNVVLGSWRAKGRHRERVVAIGDVSGWRDPALTDAAPGARPGARHRRPAARGADGLRAARRRRLPPSRYRRADRPRRRHVEDPAAPSAQAAARRPVGRRLAVPPSCVVCVEDFH